MNIKPKRVYLAGPMRFYEHYNFPAFDSAAKALRADGYVVVSPAEMDRKIFGWGKTPPADLDAAGFVFEEAMARDLKAIEECDAIVMLPGWPHSEGARREHRHAQSLGKPWACLRLSVGGMGWTLGGWFPGYPAEHYLKMLPNTSEVRITDPNTGGAKGRKVQRFELLPWDALEAVAEHFGRGAAKYEDRNWERGYPWSLSFGAMQRHLAAHWQGEDLDPELGTPHLAAAAFHILAQLAFLIRQSGTDDRPKRAAA